MIRHQTIFRKKQAGAAAVEFALIAILFFSLLLGILEFGRVLFTYNAAVEATRYGARVAVVCDIGSTAIVSRMQLILPALATTNVAVTYEPTACVQNTCERVKVKIQGLNVTPLIPVLNVTLPVPSSETSLLRESLASAIGGANNPVCS
ncbi:MAG: pilus assembly protein TadG [Methylotenera sp.]|nr:MAG: pilus assembly protein TadG [Methylotenera sp.]